MNGFIITALLIGSIHQIFAAPIPFEDKYQNPNYISQKYPPKLIQGGYKGLMRYVVGKILIS